MTRLCHILVIIQTSAGTTEEEGMDIANPQITVRYNIAGMPEELNSFCLSISLGKIGFIIQGPAEVTPFFMSW